MLSWHVSVTFHKLHHFVCIAPNTHSSTLSRAHLLATLTIKPTPTPIACAIDSEHKKLQLPLEKQIGAKKTTRMMIGSTSKSLHQDTRDEG
jgi:hypothetical protein